MGPCGLGRTFFTQLALVIMQQHNIAVMLLRPTYYHN